jgi:hypothetical protein
MHVGDFDKNGASDPIIFYYYYNRYIPFATIDKLVSQMPFLKKDLLEYKKFREVDEIKDILPNYKENEVEYKEVNEIRSMVFINNGKTYNAFPLNKEEQQSDINDFEVDEQGRIFYIGNNHDYVSELGKSSSNSGRVLGKFDKNTNSFSRSNSIGIPSHANTRRIKKFGMDKYFVICNNDISYVINK